MQVLHQYKWFLDIYMDTIISTINVMIYSDALMRNFWFIRSREDSF